MSATQFCPSCGTPHDCTGAAGGPTEAVQIAKINRDADVRIAELSASSSRASDAHYEAVAEIEAESELAVAEVEAEAGVEAAEAVAEAVTDVLAPEPAPAAPAAVVVDDQVDDTAPPPRDERDHPRQSAPAKPKGLFA